MNIEFTKEEATALLQMIDMAVKSNWLQVAEAWVVLSKKISEKFSEDNEKVEETTE